jgi:hypothetical protein
MNGTPDPAPVERALSILRGDGCEVDAARLERALSRYHARTGRLSTPPSMRRP